MVIWNARQLGNIEGSSICKILQLSLGYGCVCHVCVYLGPAIAVSIDTSPHEMCHLSCATYMAATDVCLSILLYVIHEALCNGL